MWLMAVCAVLYAVVVGRRAVFVQVVAVALRCCLLGCRGCPQSFERGNLLRVVLMALSPGGSLPRATPGLDVSGDVLPGGIPVLYLVCLWLWQVPERLALPLHSARPTA